MASYKHLRERLVVLMALRDNIFEQFGPLLLEALFDKMLDEHNELRTLLNKPPISKEAFLGSAHNHMAHLDLYEWMETEQ